MKPAAPSPRRPALLSAASPARIEVSCRVWSRRLPAHGDAATRIGLPALIRLLGLVLALLVMIPGAHAERFDYRLEPRQIADGVYVLVGAKFPINDKLRVEGSAAHYFLNDAVVARSGYTHGALSVVWTMKGPLEARLTAHATDSDAKAIFGDDTAGTRFEAALQANF